MKRKFIPILIAISLLVLPALGCVDIEPTPSLEGYPYYIGITDFANNPVYAKGFTIDEAGNLILSNYIYKSYEGSTPFKNRVRWIKVNNGFYLISQGKYTIKERN